METSTSSNNNEIIIDTVNDSSSLPRTVRTNWLLFAWSQVSGATKVLLVLSTVISLLQIATTIIILVLGSRNSISCDKPLQLYLIVFVVRVGISLPLSIYQHLFITRRRRGRTNNSDNTAIITPYGGTPTGTTTSITAGDGGNTNNTNTAVVENNTSLNPQGHLHRPSTLISGWAERLKSLLDLFAILWFIVGNYLVFSSSICSSNAALYYYTILTWVLFGYTILVIPLLACASVIFCLPCVLVTMRAFNINVSNVMQGGTKEELAKIPIYRYKSPDAESLSTEQEQQQQQQQQQQQTQTEPTMKKGNYFHKFMKRSSSSKKTTANDSTEETATVNKNNPYITIPRAEDAVCSICLSEYENDELVCKLWCDHHYHESCVIEWLALNTKCPLCKRDFRGKDYIDQHPSDDEEQV